MKWIRPHSEEESKFWRRVWWQVKTHQALYPNIDLEQLKKDEEEFKWMERLRPPFPEYEEEE